MKLALLKALISVLIGLFVAAPLSWAGVQFLEPHPGYLESVENERYRVAKEVVIVPPDAPAEASLRDRIFNNELTREFQRKYEDRFGRTQAEQFTVTSRYYETERQPHTNRTVVEEYDEQQRFGNFMIKRLTEYHVDHYMRSNPSVRPMYELKERMSNLNVQVRKDYRVKVKYSLSSNDLDLYLDNPHNIENRISWRGSDETALVLGYPVTKTISVKSDYVLEKDHWVVSGVKRLNRNWSTSLTNSQNEIENKVLVGLSWRD